MQFRRTLQFLLLYLAGVGGLLLLKTALSLSDYVIPGPTLLLETAAESLGRYGIDTLSTLKVAIFGQAIAIGMAFAVGIVGRQTNWFGSLVKVAAYNIQAYPIVALAPIIFILLGDGFLSRLLIAAMICYFPILLVVLGVMGEPIPDIEHFYRVTGKMRWQLEIKIRAFENLRKMTTVISGSATLAMAGTIVAEFIAANAGIGYNIRIALYQSDLGKILVALFLIGISLSIYQGVLEWSGRFIETRWTVRR
jgi:NitT/TauT family transport system permease protein